MNFITEIEYSPVLADKIKKVVSESKVTVIRNLPKETDYESYYKDLSRRIGFFIYADEDYKTGKITPNMWTRVEFDEARSTDTYKHSNQAQPVHTDYCYVPILDTVLLICDQPANIGGATTFIDGNRLYEILEAYNPDLLHALLEKKVKFGKGDNPMMTNTCHVITKRDQLVLVNWSKFRVSPENDMETLEITKQFDHFVTTYLEKMGVLQEIYLKKGEAIIIRDEYVLHGRNSFIGERCLLKGAIAMDHEDEARTVFQNI